MVMENVSEVVTNLPPELISRVGSLITLLQALGGFLILYIIFNIVNAILNRKKRDELKQINLNLEEIKRLLKK
jgi:hypothetical protein